MNPCKEHGWYDCTLCVANQKYQQKQNAKNNDSESILLEAQNLVHGNRGEDYGHPLDDFGRSAAMITAVLGKKLRGGQKIEPEEVGLIMECIKISRECNRPKRDNRVDGAGYWETIEMIHQERERRSKVIAPEDIHHSRR